MPTRFKGGDPEVGRLTALAKPFARQQGPAPPGRRPDGPSAREAVSFFNVIPMTPIHRTQLRTYLRLADCPVGLILNFNVPLLKHGIRRVVNKRCLTAEELAILGSASDEDE
jgi:hypothetical protein